MPPRDGQEQPLQRMAKVVNGFMSRSDAAPFLEPVDWRGLELFDYPEIITKMMDLGTIKRKLDRKQYNTAWECAQDIRLVWSNCMTYNAEGSELWMIAKSFSRKFEDRFRKIRQEFDVAEEAEDEEEDDKDMSDEDEDHEFDDEAQPPSGGRGRPSSGSGPSLDSKAHLASNLLLLNGSELGKIMSILEQECPKALEVGDPAIPEKVELVLDLMDASVFKKISEFAAERAMGRKKGMTEDVALEDVSGKRKRKR